MSDRIPLLNYGVIEQQGTPQQMYGRPQTLFSADFMGSNNRLPGHLVAMGEAGTAKIETEGQALWGTLRGAAAATGAAATALIRLERVRLVEGPGLPGGNRLRLPLVTSMFLGDRWEHLFMLGATRQRAYGCAPMAARLWQRAYGSAALQAGEHWLQLPNADLWLF